MRWRHVALSAAIGISTCLSAAAAETPYNLGVEAWKHKKYDEAAREWALALQDGEVNALNNLGYLYSTGKGVPKDPDRAFQLWTIAARYGNSESQWHMGYAYEHGEGVGQDLVYAYGWYGCALASASRLKHDDASGTERHIEDDAVASLRDLKPQLSSEQLTRAQELTQRLVDRYGQAAP